MSEENKNDKLNEPAANYFKNAELRVYHSFEEQKDDERKHSASLTPQERLKETVELILRTYGLTRESLSMRVSDNEGKITKNQ